MYKLIEPIKPFGTNSSEITECDEATYNWLVETGKCPIENFKLIEVLTNKKTKNK